VLVTKYDILLELPHRGE